MTALAAHLPPLESAIGFAVIIVLLSLGYLWREKNAAVWVDEDERPIDQQDRQDYRDGYRDGWDAAS